MKLKHILNISFVHEVLSIYIRAFYIKCIYGSCVYLYYKNILLNKKKESENIDSSIHCTFNTSHSYPSHNISESPYH